MHAQEGFPSTDIAGDECQLRLLDTVFQGQYVRSLSINYIPINRADLEKLPLQLY